MRIEKQGEVIDQALGGDGFLSVRSHSTLLISPPLRSAHSSLHLHTPLFRHQEEWRGGKAARGRGSAEQLVLEERV